MFLFLSVTLTLVYIINSKPTNKPTLIPTKPLTTLTPTLIPTVQPTIEQTLYDIKRTYPNIVFNIQEDLQSNVITRLPKEFAFIRNQKENPYYLSQISSSPPLVLVDSINMNSTMDFIQPLSGFPINKVTLNHIPAHPLNGMNITICNLEFSDRNVGNAIPRFIRDYMIIPSKGEFQPNIKFHVVKTQLKCSDASVQLKKSYMRKCDSFCKKDKCQLRAAYGNGCFKGQIGTPGRCWSSNEVSIIMGHECGHALGVTHSAGVIHSTGMPNNPYSDYNLLSDYGSNVCLLSEEKLYYQPAVLFKLGWLLNDFVYIQDQKTFTLRTATNFNKNYNNPVAIVMLDPYTGSKIFFSYHTMYHKSGVMQKLKIPNREDYIFANSEILLNGTEIDDDNKQPRGAGFVATLMPHDAFKAFQIGYWKTKEYTSPYGWHFSVIDVDLNSITVKTTFNRKDVKYFPSPLNIKMKKIGKGKTNIDITLEDYVPGELKSNWPRHFDSDNIQMISLTSGKAFNCEGYTGHVFPRVETKNKATCSFKLTSSQKQETFILTMNVATHSQTKKMSVSFL